MKKKHLSTLVIILILTMGLAGCASQETPTSSQNKSPSITYRENEISLSKLERVANVVLDSRDQPVLFDQDGLNSKFVILDRADKKIRQIPCPSQAQSSDYVDGSAFALDRLGAIYQLQQVDVYDQPNAQEPREYIKRLLVYKPGGQLEKTIEMGRMPGNASIDERASRMVADKKGRLYIIHYSGKIEVIDQAGRPVKTITGAKYHDMALDGEGNLVVIGRSGSNYYLAKINPSGKPIWKHNISEIKMAVTGFTYNRHDGCFYLADYSGIKKYDANGNFLGEIINYRSTSIFISDVFINSLNFNKAGELYISLTYNGGSSASGQQFSVFKYIPEKGAAKTPGSQKIISVAVADSNLALTLDKAGRLFEKKNPDIRVEIKDYGPGRRWDDEATRYDTYQKTMNTQILSGKGPDIISLPGLPYSKYVDKKVFADLKPLMSRDKTFNRQNYYTNILKACETRGKLYGMPISFTMPVIIADGAILDKADISINDARWTWSDFHATAKQVTQDTNNDGKPEIYALPAIDPNQLLDYMLSSDYRNLVDENKKQAHFNSPRFIKFLNMYQDLTNSLMNSRIDQGSLIYSGNRNSIAFMFEDYFYGSLSMEKCQMGARAMALALPQGTRPRDRSFEAEMLAINRSSEQQNEAWRFIKFVTDKEQQPKLQLSGLQINRLAQERFFSEMAKEKGGLCTIGDGENMKTFEQEPLTPAQIARTRQLITSLNHCNMVNPQIRKIIDTEVNSFIKGEKTAAQTASDLQNKVTLYLNE